MPHQTFSTRFCSKTNYLVDFAFARVRAKVDFEKTFVTKLVSRKQCFSTFGDLPDHTQCGVTKLPNTFRIESKFHPSVTAVCRTSSQINWCLCVVGFSLVTSVFPINYLHIFVFRLDFCFKVNRVSSTYETTFLRSLDIFSNTLDKWQTVC